MVVIMNPTTIYRKEIVVVEVCMRVCIYMRERESEREIVEHTKTHTHILSVSLIVRRLIRHS